MQITLRHMVMGDSDGHYRDALRSSGQEAEKVSPVCWGAAELRVTCHRGAGTSGPRAPVTVLLTGHVPSFSSFSRPDSVPR